MEVNGKYVKDEEGNVFSPITNIKTIFNDNGINLLDLFYPVGTIYQTLNYDFDPNESWGGDWVRLLDGATLVDSGYNVETDSTIIGSSVGQIVGNKFHTLTIKEMPKHTHTFTGKASSHSHTFNGIADSHAHGFQNGAISYTAENSACAGIEPGPAWKEGINLRTQTLGTNITPRGTITSTSITPKGLNSNTGGGIKFELTPKSLVVCMWKRIN